jgi:hypothetical protein
LKLSECASVTLASYNQKRDMKKEPAENKGKGKGKITVAVPFRNRRVPYYYIHEHVGKNIR